MDMILINGRIHTQDPERPFACALAVEGNHIAAVGGNDLIRRAGAGARVIDLQGRCVTPGLVDSHMHTAHMALSLSEVQLYGVKSLEQLKQAVRDFIRQRKLPPGQWVRGCGWNQDLFAEGRLPTRHDLDAISQEHPIVLDRVCGHCRVANSLAMRIKGVNADTACPPGGSFTLGQDGQPDGLFYEDAMALMNSGVQMEQREVETLLLEGMKRAASLGLTALGSEDLASLPCPWERVIAAYHALALRGEMPVRVVEQCLLPDEETLLDFFERGYGTGWGDDFFRLGPLKLLADGSLGARSAYLREDYRDNPGNRGIPIYTQRQLDRLVFMAHRRGMPVAVHAIGDGAIEMVLDAVAAAQTRCPNPSLRHGIIHCQITDPALIQRIRAQQMQVFAQPVFLEYDLSIAQARVGNPLASTSYAFKTMLEAGILVSAGSDCPVESLDPLCGLYCAVTRKDYQGRPQGGWFPEQRLSLQEALDLYTAAGARALGLAGRAGVLAPGMLADFTVFDCDLHELRPEQLRDARVEMTVMDGQVRYQRAEG